MKRLKRTVVLIPFLFVSASVLFGGNSTKLVYRETTQKRVEEVSYAIEEYAGSVRIRGDFNDETHIITADRNFNTMTLEIIPVPGADPVRIQKDRDRLVFAQRTEKWVSLKPGISWYQLPLCLRDFIYSENRKVSFYGLSSNFDERLAQGKGIQVIRFSARKDAFESIEVDGRRIDTVRVLIRFEHIPPLFWKAYYWYRTDDGMLVRYSEARGAPGTPKTVGELIYEGETHE